MKTDSYTKTVLTIIAACLLAITFRDVPLISTAHAVMPPQGPVDVNIAAINGRSLPLLYAGGCLPVKVDR